MMATGPQADSEAISDKEYLAQLEVSQHRKLYYPMEKIIQTPVTFFCILTGVIVIAPILMMLILTEEESSLETVKFMAGDFLFLLSFGIVILSIELAFNIPQVNPRVKRNEIREDVHENQNIIDLTNPRWISGESKSKLIGYVDKLHPLDLELGTEIGFAPHAFTRGGVHFIRSQNCFKHENKQGCTHHSYMDSNGEMVTETVYYYYQIAYFKIQGKQLVLRTDDYSPAFDNSFKYSILFQVSNLENNVIQGKILNLFVQEGAAKDIPEEWEGNVPSTPQPMKNNTKKAAIA